ncbi:hypothetical protein [Chloroflexus sp.]|uniref:hypothetical protein n=1 Tax=Chloroflexus sp. TaxID=1904827 RepID=UPI003C70F759
MNQTETRLIEEGWAALVERLGLVNASRFVMLLDRRTGDARQHLQSLWGTRPSLVRRSQSQSSVVNQSDS